VHYEEQSISGSVWESLHHVKELARGGRLTNQGERGGERRSVDFSFSKGSLFTKKFGWGCPIFQEAVSYGVRSRGGGGTKKDHRHHVG